MFCLTASGRPKGDLPLSEVLKFLESDKDLVSEDVIRQFEQSSLRFLFLAYTRSRYTDATKFSTESSRLKPESYCNLLVMILDNLEIPPNHLCCMEAMAATLSGHLEALHYLEEYLDEEQ